MFNKSFFLQHFIISYFNSSYKSIKIFFPKAFNLSHFFRHFKIVKKPFVACLLGLFIISQITANCHLIAHKFQQSNFKLSDTKLLQEKNSADCKLCELAVSFKKLCNFAEVILAIFLIKNFFKNFIEIVNKNYRKLLPPSRAPPAFS